MLTKPLPRFLAQSDAVLVNVPGDPDGVVRRYARGLYLDGQFIPSLAVALAGSKQPSTREFDIDYSIDATDVQRISASDVIDGRFDPKIVSGRHIVIGASALELRDISAVPRYGQLPGALVHILAAETLLQDRALIEVPDWVSIVLAVGLAFLIGLTVTHATVTAAALMAILLSILIEFAALQLQTYFALSIDTFVFHATSVTFFVLVLGRELIEKRLQLDRAARAHAATRNVLDQVISDNFDGVLVIDATGMVVLASRLAETVLAPRDAEGVVGMRMEKILPGEIADKIALALSSRRHGTFGQSKPREIVYERKGETPVVLDYVVTISEPQGIDTRDIEDGVGRVACLTFRDVSDRHAAQKRLTYLVQHDPLTGALSRVRLSEYVHNELADDDKRARGGMVLLIDLSRFKAVNDTLGHSYGDAVLKQVVVRLKALQFSAVARLGGDSFALYHPGILHGEARSDFCAAVLERLSEPYPLGKHRAMIGAKMGLTDTTLSGYDPDILLSHADMALSRAKAQSGGGFAVYTAELEERMRTSQHMEIELRQALARNELLVLYQPQVSLLDERLVGVEALVRWQHPRLGMVSPAQFIPIAEETGVIVELGEWILRRSCVEALSWPEEVSVSVNVSPLQFEFSDVVGIVASALADSGLKASRLVVEITEGMLISNPAAITDKLEALRAMGVGIALDDFGTGYSSLSYLGRLPVDKIKIDQSFVRVLPGSVESGAIIRAVMTLSESLNKVVVAEGVENADQAWMLRLAGCHIGQGYHYGRAMRAEEILAMADRQAGAAKDVAQSA